MLRGALFLHGKGLSFSLNKWSNMADKRPRVLLCIWTHETNSEICCTLIQQKSAKVFCAQSGAGTGETVWNYSGETLSQGASRFALDFSSPTFCFLFFLPFPTFPCATICLWVSENAVGAKYCVRGRVDGGIPETWRNTLYGKLLLFSSCRNELTSSDFFDMFVYFLGLVYKRLNWMMNR